jgi:Pyridoxal phosphate biosynthesis protein
MEGMDNHKNLYRVLMLTRHIPLKDVVKNLDIEKNVFQIKNVVNFIDKYERIKSSRIIICGVNPHNGDNGVIGDEEKTILLKIEFLQPGGSTSSRAAATAVELQFAL